MRVLNVIMGFATAMPMLVLLAIHRSRGGPQSISWGLRCLALALISQGLLFAWQNIRRLGSPPRYIDDLEKWGSLLGNGFTAVAVCAFFAVYINTRFWPSK